LRGAPSEACNRPPCAAKWLRYGTDPAHGNEPRSSSSRPALSGFVGIRCAALVLPPLHRAEQGKIRRRAPPLLVAKPEAYPVPGRRRGDAAGAERVGLNLAGCRVVVGADSPDTALHVEPLDRP